MEQLNQKINNFINTVILENNLEILDILYIFSYSLAQFSKSRYKDNKEDFKKTFSKISTRNLQKKYGLKVNAIQEKLKFFIKEFITELPESFLSYDSFYEDRELFKEILISKTSELLRKNIKKKLGLLNELGSQVLTYILNLIPIRVNESIEKGKDIDYSKYGITEDFVIETNDNDEILYFEIDMEKWTYLFNQLYNTVLKGYNFKTKPSRKKGSYIIPLMNPPQELSFWQLGDEIVKLGIGYWIPYFSGSGSLSIHFKIPYFIYDTIKSIKLDPPEIPHFIERMKNIEEKKGVITEREMWKINDLISDDTIILEFDLENQIISNPEILEKGLKLIGNQYSTSVGFIDILFKDKNDNYVVVELKRDKGTYKVVGQILKYLSWVEENLAQNKKVKGIIVVRESNKDLEYAVKGSRFLIEIKIFGKEPPIDENIKYCDNCGEINRLSAKFCVKCGEKFWM